MRLTEKSRQAQWQPGYCNYASLLCGATEGGSNVISEMRNMKHCIPEVTKTLFISLLFVNFPDTCKRPALISFTVEMMIIIIKHA
jgi:hypothetical protein